MTQTSSQNLLNYIRQVGGLMTTAEANHAGFHRKDFSRLIQVGEIERIERGVYRLTDPSEQPAEDAALLDLLEMQLRYPYARPCLISALHLHGLTTTRPSKLQFAIPAHRQSLKSALHPVESFYFATSTYDYGLQHIPVAQRELTTYTPEKTLADLLRFAPRFGRDLYLEGLKKYLKTSDRSQRDLMTAAKHLGVWPTMRHDLEVLNHDQDH